MNWNFAFTAAAEIRHVWRKFCQNHESINEIVTRSPLCVCTLTHTTKRNFTVSGQIHKRKSGTHLLFMTNFIFASIWLTKRLSIKATTTATNSCVSKDLHPRSPSIRHEKQGTNYNLSCGSPSSSSKKKNLLSASRRQHEAGTRVETLDIDVEFQASNVWTPLFNAPGRDTFGQGPAFVGRWCRHRSSGPLREGTSLLGCPRGIPWRSPNRCWIGVPTSSTRTCTEIHLYPWPA